MRWTGSDLSFHFYFYSPVFARKCFFIFLFEGLSFFTILNGLVDKLRLLKASFSLSVAEIIIDVLITAFSAK